MKLIAILCACKNSTDKQVYIPIREYEDSSISVFQRGKVRNLFKFIVSESFVGIQKGTRHEVRHEDYHIYILSSLTHDVVAYAFTQGEYPRRVIYKGLEKVLDGFFSQLAIGYQGIKSDEKIKILAIQQILKDYSDPANVDQLTKVLNKVNEIQVILHEDIQKLLEAQGDLGILVEKSKYLDNAAKQLYKNSKKVDKNCCSIF
ncbi:SNARE ykt6 (macronuclear) [Tetrahymena thermophila SB210]|uniref:SNARE ykt6 n=1 Tax=Tetrahymena thermophila (strain SB210) TaxID=312017 RepID=I7M972_TETTS|nr:SNARE ykt6 [Tetrahymena thermophila SB210]EAS01033.1 SNARE ykt6 [Tetrahymena thermophila SB210]|eukprot:XP_001021278.1 SNARE ykt6 [Tetrahymena thermophila SB210]